MANNAMYVPIVGAVAALVEKLLAQGSGLDYEKMRQCAGDDLGKGGDGTIEHGRSLLIGPFVLY